MEEFLIASKIAMTKLNDLKKIFVILGNESCDLDSAVCTLVHGLFHYNSLLRDNTEGIAVIPVLNVVKNQFNIKTEVIYHLETNKVPLELLTFRDEINLMELNKRQILALCLVDHHTLNDYDMPLVASVVEVIDHRPQDLNWPWTACDINLKKVGSCATLVAQNILEKNPQLLDQQIFNLLTGPILIDTCNFSESAARATPLDFEVTQRLELISGIESTAENRNDVYSKILRAKTDISSLSPINLLEKDLKFVNGIPIPGLPILAQEFLNLNGALEAVNSFTRARECRFTVLLGMDLKGDVMKRDCAVFSFLPNDLENKITTELYKYNDGELDLSLILSTSKENWCLKLYKQANVRATRKQILPIIQSASAGWQC
ncbi:hypothetical protein PV328_001143 [Microctonus aethiopoides]|uniref:DHHA2 domain-containing protein n=1 Tax=Microctonus aethiopoides TaxID=144406 RepID=A0AA39FWB6_9HYME|nr:hypothetical protein PV328_001143 [Microctonus aethiopoides]